MTLEQYLKQKREAQDYTQNDLAGLMGFNTCQYISNNERGMSTWAPKHFPLLSTVLEVPLALIIEMRVADLRERIVGEVERAQGGKRVGRKVGVGASFIF